jgi:hypothetical protein
VTEIIRPETSFDGASHTYQLDGEDLLGVSTIAKVGGVEETWGIASAWGFRIGYEGAHEVLEDEYGDSMGSPVTKDELREEMQKRGLTPWSKRDKAAERGNWVHDVLEALGQNNRMPDLSRVPDEEKGHAKSLMAWYVWLRPSFVAVEVQVTSGRHRFAGRYDIRAWCDARRVLETIDPLRDDPQAHRIRELAAEKQPALGLLDLKTSKGIYPNTHFPQLEGYEGAGVEMGFGKTDFRAVINTSPDGSFDPSPRRKNEKGKWTLGQFAVSWATYDDFLAYTTALRAIRRIDAANPERVRREKQEQAILAALPARSRDLAASLPELSDCDAKAVGRILGGLRKRGLVEQEGGGVWSRS